MMENETLRKQVNPKIGPVKLKYLLRLENNNL